MLQSFEAGHNSKGTFQHNLYISTEEIILQDSYQTSHSSVLRGPIRMRFEPFPDGFLTVSQLVVTYSVQVTVINPQRSAPNSELVGT